MVEMGNHSIVVHQGGHKLEGLASNRDWDDFFNWGCMYCCMGYWIVVCLTNKICLIIKYFSYYWNGMTLLSHMLN